MDERSDTVVDETNPASETKQQRDPTADDGLAPDGLLERTQADFAHIPHWGTQKLALKEYQRTMQEFRHTGSVQEKAWRDFAHFVHPRDTPDHLLAAHRLAVWAIGKWQEEQEEAREEEEKARQRREAEEARTRRAKTVIEPIVPEAHGTNFDKRGAEGDNNTEGETHVEPEPGSSFREAFRDSRNRLDALKDRLALAEHPVPAPPLPELPKPVDLLRGVAFDPDVPGRDARYEPAIPQLDSALRPESPRTSDDETQALLNAIIGECHFYMREVAFPSMCHARVADDRLHWLSKAMQLAETGAKVSKAVARLRHGPTVRETHQKITVENKLAVVQGGGGCVNP